MERGNFYKNGGDATEAKLLSEPKYLKPAMKFSSFIRYVSKHLQDSI